ncbi:SDR family NAD(P)-dependent oxidoreductase, partial [Sphingobium phenoxybenzoativorans]|uniref:SDR family NAD(P)-dependent oxidoreductase n=1 Tax=Sphingobium phenoxybenzoativorans TaxID=1592790 RepID=UPI001112FB6A
MRSALISGANKGLGLATARLLGQRGLRIWIGARSSAEGAAAAEELRGEGIDARHVTLDITSDASVAAAAARISDETGLDILINNAAI